jgi:hypothetical protein
LTARRTAPDATAVIALESVNTLQVGGWGWLIDERIFLSHERDVAVSFPTKLFETFFKIFLERDGCGEPAD